MCSQMLAFGKLSIHDVECKYCKSIKTPFVLMVQNIGKLSELPRKNNIKLITWKTKVLTFSSGLYHYDLSKAIQSLSRLDNNYTWKSWSQVQAMPRLI